MVYDDPPFGFSGGLPWNRVAELKGLLGINFMGARLADLFFRDPLTGSPPLEMFHRDLEQLR